MSEIITINSKVMATKEQVSCDLGGESAILNLKDEIYYRLLGSVAARIWELLKISISVEEIRDIILTEYQVEPNQCENDLLHLLQQLNTHNLIEVTNETHR